MDIGSNSLQVRSSIYMDGSVLFRRQQVYVLGNASKSLVQNMCTDLAMQRVRMNLVQSMHLIVLPYHHEEIIKTLIGGDGISEFEGLKFKVEIARCQDKDHQPKPSVPEFGTEL